MRIFLCKLLYFLGIFYSISWYIFIFFPTTNILYSLCDNMSGLVIHLWEIPLWKWGIQLPFLKRFCCYLRVFLPTTLGAILSANRSSDWFPPPGGAHPIWVGSLGGLISWTHHHTHFLPCKRWYQFPKVFVPYLAHLISSLGPILLLLWAMLPTNCTFLLNNPTRIMNDVKVTHMLGIFGAWRPPFGTLSTWCSLISHFYCYLMLLCR